MTSKIQPLPNINPHEIARKGEEIYQTKFKEKLEKNYFGKFVAIEVDSGEYFVGDTLAAASDKAKKKFPGAVTYIKKIGFPAVFRMPGAFQPPSYGSLYR